MLTIPVESAQNIPSAPSSVVDGTAVSMVVDLMSNDFCFYS